MMQRFSTATIILLLLHSFFPTTTSSLSRLVHILDKEFVITSTNASIILSGPNVVVKGPPYLPSVSGTSMCNDIVSGACALLGTCTSCSTFNEADIINLRSRGWNTIRLGVVWTGAQPLDSDSLDPSFLNRLHAILNLTDAAGIYVVLDNHGDMVSSAGCGNGVPMWVSQAAAPDLIGLPLATGFPYNLIPELDITALAGYSVCGNDTSKWQKYAGDPNYNLLNECCQAMNSPNPPALGFSTINQRTMDYLITAGPGRDAFIRYWRLIAEAVITHPSAIACELMNEPMTIRRSLAFDTWREVGLQINTIIPDMSIAIADVSEGIVIPSWVIDIIGGNELLSNATVAWIKNSKTVFYAWHWYGFPTSVNDTISDAIALGESWGIPTFATEFMDCMVWNATTLANISHLYWHYSAYCNTGPTFGNRSVPNNTFGACILGWGSGDSSYSC